MKNRRRMSAALMCVVFVLAMLVSSVFMIHETGHHCTGEDCPICQTIAMNSQLLRLFAAVMLVLSFLAGILHTGHAWARVCGFSAPVSGTLVGLKVRMNN